MTMVNALLQTGPRRPSAGSTNFRLHASTGWLPAVTLLVTSANGLGFPTAFSGRVYLHTLNLYLPTQPLALTNKIPWAHTSDHDEWRLGLVDRSQVVLDEPARRTSTCLSNWLAVAVAALAALCIMQTEMVQLQD